MAVSQERNLRTNIDHLQVICFYYFKCLTYYFVYVQ